MDPEIQGKVVSVAGVGRGLGTVIADTFAGEGVAGPVVPCHRSPEGACSAQERSEVGGRVGANGTDLAEGEVAGRLMSGDVSTARNGARWERRSAAPPRPRPAPP